MRSTMILLPLVALLSSVFAAPTTKCGWRPGSKPDITKPVPEPARINHRAAPPVDGSIIEDPLDVVTRATPPTWKAVPNPKMINC